MVEMNIRRLGELEYQAAEAINTLCMNLSFAGGDIKKIMVTSCHPQEGKSFVTMNLLKAMAGLGMRVVLVDADIRASALRGTYGIEVDSTNGKKYLGLCGYLSGKCDIEDILGKTNIPNAHLILAGNNVMNSLPLFNTPRLGKLLDALRKEYDVVLVDAPPVGTIIDAAKIAINCDGTLFVIQSGAISVEELKDAIKQIDKTGCPVLGYVMNKFDEKEFGGKYYYHKSYYSNYGGKPKKSRKRMF